MVELTDNKIYIIILNWNGWEDTLECVDSLFKQDYLNYQIIIVDNNSENNSVEKLSRNFVDRNVGIKIFDESDFNLPLSEISCFGNDSVVIIRNRVNYGFGMGNNVGINYAINCGDCDYIWLLNNDTVVDSHALIGLLDEDIRHNGNAMIGSVICYYDARHIVQAVGGGRFFPFWGRSKLFCNKKTLNNVLIDLHQESFFKINYIMGASLFICIKNMKLLGGFDDDYFLYSEDVDLSLKALNCGLKLSVSLDSIVYHKDSASTRNRKSHFFKLYCESAIVCIRKNYSLFYLPFTILSCIGYGLFYGKSFKNIISTIIGIKNGLLKKL